jgi:hypothetical protein
MGYATAIGADHNRFAPAITHSADTTKEGTERVAGPMGICV